MPPKPFTHRFSAFVGGQNTVRDPLALSSGNKDAPEEGFRVVGAELRSGILRGIYGPGTAIAGPAVVATTRFVFYVYGTGWVAKQMNTDLVRQNWGVRDNWAYGNVTYMTDIDAAGAVSVPRIHYGGASYPLGLTPPAAAATSNAAGAGALFQVSYTYVDLDGSAAVLESNPSPRSGDYQVGDTITAVDPTATQTRVTHWRAYATKSDDPNGIQYFLAEVAFPTVTLAVASLAALELARPLDWAVGGFPDDDLATSDHSPAPSLTCMSNTLHGGENGVDGNFSGFLFAGVDHWLHWSEMGNPQYWPSKNLYRFNEPTLAIISIGTVTYVFTQTGVWVASGATSNAVQISKTRVDLGPMLSAGKSVVSTPYGILYVSREGVMLFDGQNATNLTREMILPSEIQASAYWCAGFTDDYYLFSNASDVTYALDLRNFPQRVALAKIDRGVVAFHRVGGGMPVDEGHYTAMRATLDLKPWRPDARTLITGAVREAAQHKTGAVSFGDSTRIKDLTKWRLDGKGTVTMKVFVNPTDLTSDATPAFTVAVALPMPQARWFPRTCSGKTFSFLFDVPADAELFAGSHFEGVAHV